MDSSLIKVSTGTVAASRYVEFGTNDELQISYKSNGKNYVIETYEGERYELLGSTIESISNNTPYSIKVNYNDITFSDTNNGICRMMSKDLSYDEKNSYHQSVIIFKDSHIHDEFTPVNNFIGINKITTNIYGYKTTTISKIFTNILPIDIDRHYQSLKKRREIALDNRRKVYVGSKIKMYIPIEIDGMTNEYLFTFKVKNVILQKYNNR